MKQIVAIIKPFLAERVINAVTELPVEDVIVREVKGFGRQKNELDSYQDNEFKHAFVAKVEITIWIEDSVAEQAVETIKEVSRTGRLGDGKILIMPTTLFS